MGKLIGWPMALGAVLLLGAPGYAQAPKYKTMSGYVHCNVSQNAKDRANGGVFSRTFYSDVFEWQGNVQDYWREGDNLAEPVANADAFIKLVQAKYTDGDLYFPPGVGCYMYANKAKAEEVVARLTGSSTASLPRIKMSWTPGAKSNAELALVKSKPAPVATPAVGSAPAKKAAPTVLIVEGPSKADMAAAEARKQADARKAAEAAVAKKAAQDKLAAERKKQAEEGARISKPGTTKCQGDKCRRANKA